MNGVRVLRFPVTKPRSAERLRGPPAAAFAAPGNLQLGRAWMRRRARACPRCTSTSRIGSDYDAVAFMTYLYATTAEGLPRVARALGALADRARRAAAPLRVFDEVFAAPACSSSTRRRSATLAERRFGVEPERARIAGVGVSDPPDASRSASARRASSGRTPCTSAGWTGRRAWTSSSSTTRATAPPMRTGSTSCCSAAAPCACRASGGCTLGFVSEQLKHDALAGAAVVVCPPRTRACRWRSSRRGRHGRPTLANEVSPVLLGQTRRSGGGLWYGSADEYSAMLDLLARARPLADAIGMQGRRHVAGDIQLEPRARRVARGARGSGRGASLVTEIHKLPPLVPHSTRRTSRVARARAPARFAPGRRVRRGRSG